MVLHELTLFGTDISLLTLFTLLTMNFFKHTFIAFIVIVLTIISTENNAFSQGTSVGQESIMTPNLQRLMGQNLALLVNIEKNKDTDAYEFTLANQSVKIGRSKNDERHNLENPAETKQQSSETHGANHLKCVFRDKGGRAIATAIVRNPLRISHEGMTSNDELTRAEMTSESGAVVVRTNFQAGIAHVFFYEGDEDGSWAAQPMGGLELADTEK